MQKIRKAIIPAAGYGTRFLPATKALQWAALKFPPKEFKKFLQSWISKKKRSKAPRGLLSKLV